jgi:PAS domain S-box-containing protein
MAALVTLQAARKAEITTGEAMADLLAGAQARLKENEEKLRLIAAGTPDHILLQDAQLRYIYVINPQLGLTEKDMLGKTDYDILSREDAEKITQIKRRVLETGNPEYVSEHILGLDGNLQYFEGTYLPRRDVTGHIDGIMGYFRNVTESKLSEEAVKAAEAKASALIKYAPTAIYEIDVEGTRFLSFNDAFCSITGYSRDELSDMAPAELLDNESKGLFADRIRRKLSGDEADESVEYKVRKKDGSIIYVTLNTSFSEHFPDTALVIGHDVTERRKMEEALRESEERFRSVFERTAIGMVLGDLDGRVIRSNEAFEKMLGYNKGELYLKNYSNFTAAEDLEIERSLLSDLITGKTDYYKIEKRYIRKDGRRIVTQLTVSAIKGTSGDPLYVIVLAEDVTERDRVERLKDDFIGMVSHEMRTPLTVIIGAIDTALSSGISAEDSRTLLLDAGESAGELADILENLLELSRFQSNRLVMHKLPLSVGRLAAKCIDRIATQSDHRFTLDIPDDIPPVEADEIRMHTILCNLLGNAVKYSPSGTEIRVFAHRRENDLVVGISDQGPGIAKEDQQRVFEQFERLGDPARARGLGLGLVVCKRLVEAHRGEIWVESEPGKGATFLFTIPLQ